MMHLLSIVVLLLKIHHTQSCRGDLLAPFNSPHCLQVFPILFHKSMFFELPTPWWETRCEKSHWACMSAWKIGTCFLKVKMLNIRCCSLNQGQMKEIILHTVHSRLAWEFCRYASHNGEIEEENTVSLVLPRAGHFEQYSFKPRCTWSVFALLAIAELHAHPCCVSFQRNIWAFCFRLESLSQAVVSHQANLSEFFEQLKEP